MEVKLIPKKPEDLKDAPKDLSMKFEDGAWRLDFGGVKAMMKQMGTKQEHFRVYQEQILLSDRLNRLV